MSAVKFKFSGDSSELLKELENIKEKIRETSGQAANMRVAKGGKADVEGLGGVFQEVIACNYGCRRCRGRIWGGMERCQNRNQ